MTVITRYSEIWRVKHTQNTLELSEQFGYDITDKEFIGGVGADKVRGYVVLPLMGGGMIRRGPITLRREDVEKVIYE